MSNPLAWIAAIGGVAATIGAWRTEATARWQARRERLRTDEARRENELHRMRFTQVWEWMNSHPDRAEAARWYAEWTGTDAPRRGGLDPTPQAPGLHSAAADDAYQMYLGTLAERYRPGRLGRPRWHLRAITRRKTQRADETGTEGPTLSGSTQEG